MKMTRKRNNNFILAITDEEAEKLKKLAEENDHAPSKQAYIIIRNVLREIQREENNGVIARPY